MNDTATIPNPTTTIRFFTSFPLACGETSAAMSTLPLSPFDAIATGSGAWEAEPGFSVPAEGGCEDSGAAVPVPKVVVVVVVVRRNRS